MKPLLLAASLLLTLSAAVFADSLSFTLDPPATQKYPPGAPTFDCQNNGDVTGVCVMFTGLLENIDGDGSVINLDALTIDFSSDPIASTYFTLDNTYFNNVPAGLSDGFPFLPTYSGLIFGLGFNPATTPFGIYHLTADLQADGGDSDPSNLGYTETANFTVVISPEPSESLLILAALLAIIAIKTCGAGCYPARRLLIGASLTSKTTPPSC